MRIYLGIDPTGAKLHIGHGVPLRKLKEFVDAGHHVIFLIGSFTAMIGDPTGRDASREALTKEQVEKNFQSYKAQAGKILDFSKVEIRYNHEWLEKLGFEDIAKLASNFTVQQMLKRDMFVERVKKDMPISLHEFLYPLMVGYDSVMLDVDCELGGNDQLFNMLAGRTLQTALGKRDKFVLTTKLIEGLDGRKMSKTYDNCVYLDDEPNDMYGKLLSAKDELITTYLECCTSVPMQEIADIQKAMKKGENPKVFKMRMAKEIVTLYHGAEAAAHAEEQFNKQFSKGQTPDDMKKERVPKDITVAEAMVVMGLASSKSDAKRLIAQNGVELNEQKVTAPDQQMESGVLRVGRKYAQVEFQK